MGYIIKPLKNSWKLVHRKDSGKAGVVDRRVEPGTGEFVGLGLIQGMSIEEAKAAVKRARVEVELERLQKRRASIDLKLREKELIESAWLPSLLVQEFEKSVLRTTRIRKDRWLIAKTLIAKLEIPPQEWHWQPEEIFKLFQDRADSLDYSRRLLRIINKWGMFYSKKTNRPYLPVEPPAGPDRVTIKSAYYSKKPPRRTQVIRSEQVAAARGLLPKKKYNGLHVMLWAGLRPEELKQLIANEPGLDWRLQYDDPRFSCVLHVFQHKLARQGIDPELCWKAVPLCEPEQAEIQQILETKNLENPPIQLLKEKLGIRLTQRSARKTFVALMQLRGYSERCYDRWLGHLGQTTLRNYYEEKQLAYWEPPQLPEKKKA